MNENPPLTAATLISAANAVRTAAAQEGKKIGEVFARVGSAADMTADDMKCLAEALREIPKDTITYTNRAARRARARAERKN